MSNSLIVSLTSYPPRFPTFATTLKSLLDEHVQAIMTILRVAEADAISLLVEVRQLSDYGLQIRTCADSLSYKKLIPALAAFRPRWW